MNADTPTSCEFCKNHSQQGTSGGLSKNTLGSRIHEFKPLLGLEAIHIAFPDQD